MYESGRFPKIYSVAKQITTQSAGHDAPNAVQAVTGAQTGNPPILPAIAKKGKCPYAVLSGRIGGYSGGPARAKALTKARRAEIARLGAAARWKK